MWLVPRAVVRWIVVFYRELVHDRAFERAGALAYGSLVSLVPMLVLVFAILGATGLLARGPDFVEKFLFGSFLADIPEVRETLIPGLIRINLGAAGALGTVGWLAVSARIYMMMERAYSDVFRVRVNRTFGRRLLNFYLALTAVPVLLVLAVLGSGQVADRLGWAWWSDLLLSTALPMGLLTLAIRVLPGTRVYWMPACAGGLVSGMLVKAGGWGFAQYVRTVASHDPIVAIYGSIGLVPVFLVWLFLLWVFVLLGVEVAHVAQDYKSLVRVEREQRLVGEDRVRLPSVDDALEVMAAVAASFQEGRGPMSQDALAAQCRIGFEHVATVLEVLERAGFVARTDTGWVMARPPAGVPLCELVDAWRSRTSIRRSGAHAMASRVESALHASFEGTLADVAPRSALSSAGVKEPGVAGPPGSSAD
jgi:membrane protein